MDKRFRDGRTAIEWLIDYMTAEGPAVDSAELYDAAKANGISRRTLQRARHQCNIDVEYARDFAARRTRWIVVPRPF